MLCTWYIGCRASLRVVTKWIMMVMAVVIAIVGIMIYMFRVAGF